MHLVKFHWPPHIRAAMSFSRQDYIAILAVLIIWAGNVIAIKLAVTELPPLTAATLRFVAAGLIFLPFI